MNRWTDIVKALFSMDFMGSEGYDTPTFQHTQTCPSADNLPASHCEAG